MGFRAIEIDALLRAAELEHERQARASAANLGSDTTHRTEGGERQEAVCRAPRAPSRRANGAAGRADISRQRALVSWRAVVTGLFVIGVLTAAVFLAAYGVAS